MSMFPHTVTVYRTSIETDPATLADVTTNQITVLGGVLLDTSRGASIRGKQPANADEVTLYIPFETEAVDGLTGETVQLDIPVDDKTFFIKGEVIEPDMDRAALEKAYGHVYSVTRADEMDFGGLPHWEIGGK